MSLTDGIILGALVFIIVPTWLVTLVVYLADLLWAIPAAIISKRVATENDLDAGFYAKNGFLYAMLSFVLWRYFIRKMRGESIDENGARVSYIFMFIGWLGASVVGSFILTLSLLKPAGGLSETLNFLALIWTLANAVLWIRTLRGLLVQSKSQKENIVEASETEDPSNVTDRRKEILIEQEYLYPVLYSKMSFLVTLGMTVWAFLATAIL